MFGSLTDNQPLISFMLWVSVLNNYRNTYDNLKRYYEHFGQFQYSDQRNIGKIKTYVFNRYGPDNYIEVESRIKESNTLFFRSVKVYEEGKIKEEEWDDWSKLNRIREIYQSGLWEEYSIHRTTGFGIRKVVYPDAQLFTNEVYDYGRRWNAIGEETYAIQNKSIPYLLGDNNEMKQYKFVTEDGLFNIIDLGKNYKEESLNSISY